MIDASYQVRVLDNSTPATLLSALVDSAAAEHPEPVVSPRARIRLDPQSPARVERRRGGELDAFNFGTLAWSVVAALNNASPKAMVHDPVTDTIYGIDSGLFGGTPLMLHRYNASGALTSSSTLGLRTWGWGFDNFQLYALGTNLVAIGPGKALLNGNLVVRHVFVIDPSNGNIVCASFLTG